LIKHDGIEEHEIRSNKTTDVWITLITCALKKLTLKYHIILYILYYSTSQFLLKMLTEASYFAKC
jgi:hypothetical protein